MGGAIARIPEPTGWQKFTTAPQGARPQGEPLVLAAADGARPPPALPESDAERAAQQLADAPKDVLAALDQSYDNHPDCRLDVYLPGSATASESLAPGRRLDPRRRLRRRHQG